MEPKISLSIKTFQKKILVTCCGHLWTYRLCYSRTRPHLVSKAKHVNSRPCIICVDFLQDNLFLYASSFSEITVVLPLHLENDRCKFTPLEREECNRCHLKSICASFTTLYWCKDAEFLTFESEMKIEILYVHCSEYIHIHILEYLHDEIFVKLYFRFFLQTNRELSWDRLCRRWWHRRLS